MHAGVSLLTLDVMPSKGIYRAIARETSSTSTRFLITNLISLQFTLFAICLLFSSPPLHQKIVVLFALFFVRRFLVRSVFVCNLVCVVTMSQENTKLCDFFNTNNNDFISTPIAPPATSAESYDINVALLNLGMKGQFLVILMRMTRPI